MKPILHDFDFDVYQRFQGIINVVEHLALNEEGSLLDVGGYPGTLADALSPRYALTLDTEYCHRNDYVMGSGEALPFPSDSFEAVISSDTLEHVPSTLRSRFLNELLRVSGNWLIIGAPCNTPGVKLAESLLNEFTITVTERPNPWLEEHLRFGLPELHNTMDEITHTGASCISVPNGDLLLWTMAMFTRVLLDLIPDGMALFDSTNHDINSYWRESIFPSSYSYRHIIVAQKNGGTIPNELRVPTARNLAIDDKAIEEKIRSIASAFSSIGKRLKNTLQASEERDVPVSTLSYIDQIEKALGYQETKMKDLQKENEELAKKIAHYERNPFIRLMRKFLAK